MSLSSLGVVTTSTDLDVPEPDELCFEGGLPDLVTPRELSLDEVSLAKRLLAPVSFDDVLVDLISPDELVSVQVGILERLLSEVDGGIEAAGDVLLDTGRERSESD